MVSNNTIDPFKHPIFDPFNYFLNTDAYDEFKEDITRWLWTGCIGGYVTGHARSGKTSAVEKLCIEIRSRDGTKPPSLLVTIPPRDVNTIAELYRILCRSVNLRVTNASKAGVMVNQFTQYILDEITQKKSGEFVLFIDEMQRLTIKQLGVFAEIYDYLRPFKLRLFVVLIANTLESSFLLDEVSLSIHDHKRGRLFGQHHEFTGLATKNQFEKCLKQYDSLRYPDKTGPTCTELFLPNYFKDGWRMKDLSTPLWEEFKVYKAKYGIQYLGMQYFREVVDSLLTDHLRFYGPDDIPSELISMCFEQSSMTASSITINS